MQPHRIPRIRSTMLVACSVLAFASAGAGQTTTEIIDSTGDGSISLRDPWSITVDDSGNVFVASLFFNPSTGTGFFNRVFKIEPGGLTTVIIDDLGSFLDGPVGVAVDGSGNAYVTGTFSHNAFKITPGGLITQIINIGGDLSNSLVGPVGVAVDGSGNVYVTGCVSDNVFKITDPGLPTQTITQIIDSSGDGAGNSLDAPEGIAVDGSGNVYVTGARSDNAFKITDPGLPTQTITEIIDATGDGTGNSFVGPGLGSVAVDGSGNIYVTGHNSDNAFKITRAGVITEILNSTGGLLEAYGVAIDGSDNVYLTGLGSDNAFKITPAGVITEIIDSTGDGAGNTLDASVAVAVDSSGNVYVAGHDSCNAFKVAPCSTPSPATSISYNGSGTNLDTLSASKVVVGSDWNVSLAPQAMRGPGAWVLFLRSASAAGHVVDMGFLLGLPSAGASELLVDPLAFMANFTPPMHTGGGSTAEFSTYVPWNCSLVGGNWFAQALVLGDLPTGAGALDPWFSSAVGGVIGTF